jgi:hypothetical protein
MNCARRRFCLRQSLLTAAGDENKKWELLMRSLPAFGTLDSARVNCDWREPAAGSKREAVTRLSAKAGIDLGAFTQVFDLREGKAERGSFEIDDVVCAVFESRGGAYGGCRRDAGLIVEIRSQIAGVKAVTGDRSPSRHA